jgi:hypothetical protein
LRPLPQKFDELEDLLLNHRRTLSQNTGVPFVRLVYRPDQEVACARLRETLARTLGLKGVTVRAVSCRGVIFTHYEERGRLEQLYLFECQTPERLKGNIARHAREELKRRLAGAVESLGKDGALFVVDTAFVYPYFQLGSVLDAFTNRIVPPMALVVFYPGEVDVDGRLLFLGQRPSGYYRTRDLI